MQQVLRYIKDIRDGTHFKIVLLDILILHYLHLNLLMAKSAFPGFFFLSWNILIFSFNSMHNVIVDTFIYQKRIFFI